MSYRNYSLLAARELLQQFIREQGHGHQAASCKLHKQATTTPKIRAEIQAVLTDNGKSFTDRFTQAGERKPSGRHPFD